MTAREDDAMAAVPPICAIRRIGVDFLAAIGRAGLQRESTLGNA
jgi:hypothetical protein